MKTTALLSRSLLASAAALLALSSLASGAEDSIVPRQPEWSWLPENPIIRDAYTADPAAFVYKDRVYLYVGHDEAKADGRFYDMKDWLCYSSDDMKTWTAHGPVLDLKVFPWAKQHAWAGQLIERNGKFYWYICAYHRAQPGFAIGVAVGDSPTGPFKDVRGTALITNDMTTDIGIDWDDLDPTVMIDKDGQAYLYWGNSKCRYAKLKENMIELDGPIVNVPVEKYTEAPWIHERNGVYYLSYASGFPERIAYATSDKITGPFTYRGVICDLVPRSNTVHQAIISFKGKDYFIYHTGALPGGSSYRRSVCIEPLSYAADGSILPITQTGRLGEPGETTLRCADNADLFVAERNLSGRVDDVHYLPSGRWFLRPGLAGVNTVSLESVAEAGAFLTPRDYGVIVDKPTSDSVRAEASFSKRAGLSDAKGVSFESSAQPGSYLLHREGLLWVAKPRDEAEKAAATFYLGK